MNPSLPHRPSFEMLFAQLLQTEGSPLDAQLGQLEADLKQNVARFSEFISNLHPELRSAVLRVAYTGISRSLFELHAATETFCANQRFHKCSRKSEKRNEVLEFKTSMNRLFQLYKGYL